MDERKTIGGQTFSAERALYRTHHALVTDCRFEGEEDGESALKESSDLVVQRCYMDLRYPFWHVKGLALQDSELTEHCRAALWYDRAVTIQNCTLNGIKALRECRDVTLRGVRAASPELGWRCDGVQVCNSTIDAQYGFFESKHIEAKNLNFSGKYSFQYVRDVCIEQSDLHTKDAFWHAKNVTVTDSVLCGEYLGWYSEGLTLIRCRIVGTQPLCYCKRLRLVDCTMEGCDLSFEYSDVHADVRGRILSVKNPRSGTIAADGYGEVLLGNSVYPSRARIVTRSAAE